MVRANINGSLWYSALGILMSPNHNKFTQSGYQVKSLTQTIAALTIQPVGILCNGYCKKHYLKFT